MEDLSSADNNKLDQRLQPVLQALERFRLLEKMQERQTHRLADVEGALLRRQEDAELSRRLKVLDGADVAQLLEMLPGESRLRVWRALDHETAGEALVEVTGHVADDLVTNTAEEVLMGILDTLKPGEIRAIKQQIPPELLQRFKQCMEEQARRQLETIIEYPEGTVGALMRHDQIVLSGKLTVTEATAALRELRPLPDQTNKVFVRDSYQRFLGTVLVTELLLEDGERTLRDIMLADAITFEPQESCSRAGQAFERYDLISVPVVDSRKHILGRLTVESVMDYIREQAEDQALASAGLSEDTDLFGPIWKGAQERWPWLVVNLLTAFLATRFIALFESTLEQFVSLAVLMPIIASIGGNTGNQTIALFVRGLALEQIKRENTRFLLRKELTISLINGALWGALLAVVAGLLYRDMALGMVMMAAMTLNLLVAAAVGVALPLLAHRLGRDPAMGSSVVLTFTTDSMGFFIFLGLATLFLL